MTCSECSPDKCSKACRNKIAKALYKQRKAEGVCPNDARPKAPGRTICQTCLDRLKRNSDQRRYGLTPDGKKALFESYDNQCAVCSEPKILCVDHDHVTGIVRGVLCKKCNQALGLLMDSKDNVANLLDYISKRDRISL